MTLDLEPITQPSPKLDLEPVSGAAQNLDLEPIAKPESTSLTPESDKALQALGVDTQAPEDSYVPGQHPIAENAAQAGVELLGGMIPKSVDQYAKQLFPPLGVYDAFQHIRQGNLGDIPFVGRVPEIMSADKTPAWSKERFLAAGRTLMDVGLLAGAGKGEPVEPGPVPKVGETPVESGLQPKPEPVGVTETLAELKRRNVVTPGEVAIPEPSAAPALTVPESANVGAVPPTGIANKYLDEVYGDASPSVVAGKGPKEWKALGQSRLEDFQQTGNPINDPYAVLTGLRDGRVPVAKIPHDVSLLRAEHQRLVEDARQSEGTPEYPQKAQTAFDMATAIKQVAHGPASDVFRALQEHDAPNYDNITDFDQAVRDRLGRESTPEEKTHFTKIVNDVRSTGDAAGKEVDVAQRQVQKYRGKEKMSFDDAAKSIRDQIEQLTKGCIL